MNNASMYPLERLVAIRNERVSGEKNPDWPYIGLEHLAQGEPTLLGTLPSSASVSINSVFYPNDILFGKLRPNLQKSLQVWFPGYCSTDIIVFQTAKGIYSGFEAKIFQWSRTFDAAVKSTEGTKMPRTSWHNLRHLEVFVPSLPEQRAIAAVLDTVDTAIQRAEQLIAKLKLMKAGLLHDLLTRGIDAEGNLRDPVAHPEQFKESALGLIPKEWEIDRVERCLISIDAGKSFDCPDTPATGDQWGVIKVSAIKPEGFQPYENKVILDPRNVTPSFEIHEGDLLISRANTAELVGIVCYVQNPPPRLLLSDKSLRLRTKSAAVDVQYLCYAMQTDAVRRQIVLYATGSSGSMKNIGQDQIKSLWISYPNIDEQKQVAALLASHDTRIHTEETAHDKLKLLKAGLMDDLLTGRVRVGDLKVDLP